MTSRRRFLCAAGAAGGALAASPALDVVLRFAQDTNFQIEVASDQYKKLEDKKTQCFICPLDCILKPGETCFCRTRHNVDGKLICHAYNNPCVLTMDPIEKLPLSHYLPGEQTLSLAVGGCNLRCLYCQNWQQSQAKPQDLKNFTVTKEDAVSGMKKKDGRIIAFTYTEPVSFYEYIRDVSEYAHKQDKKIRTVAATALFVSPDALKRWCKHVDAFAVALKGFDEKFYDRVLGSKLKPVQDALVVLKEQKVWFEIVSLIVPTYNDDLDKIREMCKWIRKELGADVPLHFGRFVPEYKLKDLPRTPVPTLEKCRAIAQDEGLQHAYIFNVSPHEGNNTFCHKCGAEVIQRLGFKIVKNDLKKGTCPKCSAKIPGVWA